MNNRSYLAPLEKLRPLKPNILLVEFTPRQYAYVFAAVVSADCGVEALQPSAVPTAAGLYKMRTAHSHVTEKHLVASKTPGNAGQQPVFVA